MVYATTYRYDLAGNKLEERKAVSEKDGAIQYSLRRWTYDIHNNITEEKTWLTLQSENSASGMTRTICNTYDKQNRLIRVTDNLGAEVKYTYNSIRKRTSEERKVNAEETQLIKYLYDETGRLTDRAEKLNQKRKGTSPPPAGRPESKPREVQANPITTMPKAMSLLQKLTLRYCRNGKILGCMRRVLQFLKELYCKLEK